MGLRREKRLENLVADLSAGNPCAGIDDRDQHLVFGIPLRLDCEVPCHIPLADRFDTIKHEVHKDLLQLHSVRPDIGQLRPSSVRMEIACRPAALRSMLIISRITSFTSTDHRNDPLDMAILDSYRT